MNSSLNRHLLEHLCGRYGGGNLPGGRSDATLADTIGAPRETGRLGEASLPARVRFPVADVPADDIVLDDPRDDAVAEITLRGQPPVSGRS